MEIVTQSIVDRSTIDATYRVKSGLHTEKTLLEYMKYKHCTDSISSTRGDLVTADCIDFDHANGYDLFTIRFEYNYSWVSKDDYVE